MAAKSQAKSSSSLIKPPGRAISTPTRIFLFTLAGGRCEFPGCNRYLMEHHVTKGRGIFAQMAHIWGFSPGGPRRNQSTCSNVHSLDNLMLLCPGCHKLVDEDPETYTVEHLREIKTAHEDRVFQLTDTRPDQSTVAIVLTGQIAGDTPLVTKEQIDAAILPRYASQRNLHKIDLTGFTDRQQANFWTLAATQIREGMSGFYRTPFDGGEPKHVSVFALAPIPLLMVLGSCLSDKRPTVLYQRHRDTDDWQWKKNGPSVGFACRIIQRGAGLDKVAVLVSVSGSQSLDDIAACVDSSFTVYQLVPDGVNPSLGILQTEATLQAFRTAFQQLIRTIDAEHPGLDTVHLFPAVPAPCAVAMGRDLLPKRDPAFLVYDFDKSGGGFTAATEINTR